MNPAHLAFALAASTAALPIAAHAQEGDVHMTGGPRLRVLEPGRGQPGGNSRDAGPGTNPARSFTDGGPQSATVFLGDTVLQDFGSSLENGPTTAGVGSRQSVGITADYGDFKVDGVSGKAYTLPLAYTFKLNPRLALAVQAPIRTLRVAGENTVQGGPILSLACAILPPGPGHRLTWSVTPTVGLIASGGGKLNADGAIFGGSLSSVLSYDFGRFTLTMGNFFGSFGSTGLNNEVDQQFFKNGLRVGVPLGRRLVFEAYVIHTQFLRDAPVDNFFTIGADMGYRFVKRLALARGKDKNTTDKDSDAAEREKEERALEAAPYLRLGFYGDVGGRQDSRTAHLRIGTGFKF